MAYCKTFYWQVDVFMDVAFAALRVGIKFLQTRLLAESVDFFRNSSHTAEEKLNHLCQQCEASLQFLQSLCQHKLFRERLLKNKVLSQVSLCSHTLLLFTLIKFQI